MKTKILLINLIFMMITAHDARSEIINNTSVRTWLRDFSHGTEDQDSGMTYSYAKSFDENNEFNVGEAWGEVNATDGIMKSYASAETTDLAQYGDFTAWSHVRSSLIQTFNIEDGDPK